MESTLQMPALTAANTTPKAMTIVYWIVTALLCLQMSFTVYAQLRLPEVAEAFTHLGFPAYFRVELSWAKLLGVALRLAPAPVRIKEWAYAGFAINLASAEGVGPGGGDQRALGDFVFLLAVQATAAGTGAAALVPRQHGVAGAPSGPAGSRPLTILT